MNSISERWEMTGEPGARHYMGQGRGDQFWWHSVQGNDTGHEGEIDPHP